MSIEACLVALRDDADFMRQVTAWREFAPRPGRTVPLPADLDARLVHALAQRGITTLYTHQGEAYSAARGGDHLVIVTATASGKTLCYNLPVLETLLRDHQARALYLFPTKALAQDQLAELNALLTAADDRHSGRPSPILSAAAYDGDTPKGQRRALRSGARIILSNPDMLHTGILPQHPQWAALFSNLRYVILDELHTYRGVFGSHVANVLRRVQRICAFYGARPQFICTSATIANPQDLAQNLLEAPVRLIDDDGAPRGARHMILYNPPLIDRALGLRRSSVLEAERIAGRFLEHQVQTIVFARSRLTTEVLLTYLRQRLSRTVGARGGVVDVDTVRGYRGGYLPAQRRDIEAGLRRGEVRAVVATNALELGMDIGQLGAAVLTGFPGTIASTWQQAGRAGRRQGVAVAILVATAGALDQYIITHPQYLFARSPEHAYIEPNNLVILSGHVQCAAFELPFSTTETFGRVPFTQDLLQFLADQGVIHRSGDTWYWMSQAYPAEGVSLRTASADTITIVAQGEYGAHAAPANSPDDAPEETVIGILDRFSAPALLHTGAVYLHEGRSYEVLHLDWAGGRALVQPATLDYYTEASGTTSVTVREAAAVDPAGAMIRGYGDVVVTSQVTTYRKVRLYTHENLGWGTIELPPQTIDTRAYWLSFPDTTLERLRAQGLWRSDPIEDYGPNWEVQRSLARARDGHRCTVCRAPEMPARQHDVHHIVPFRSFGYIPGTNEAYLEANRLENLVTLCRPCHRRAETAVRIRSGLAGLAYALANIAPLHLMCDPRDLGMTYEVKSLHNGMPTVTLYDRVAGGIGFAERLYELHRDLLVATRELVTVCSCLNGCPACVGPSLEVEEGLNTRQLTLVLVEAALG